MTRNRTAEDIIAEFEPKLREAFLAAIRAIRDEQQIALLVRLLAAGRVDDAIRAIGLNPAQFGELRRGVAAVFDEGGNFYAAGIPPAADALGIALAVHFDFHNARAERHLRDHGADLVTGIVDDQKTAVRNHLVAGLDAGRNPRDVALDLVGRINRASGRREGGVIGLTAQQEQWARNFAAELRDPAKLSNALRRKLLTDAEKRTLRSHVESGEPLSEKKIGAFIRAYRTRALRYRAETIARTETLQALNVSRHEAYRQAVESGAVQESKIKRFWLTARDERVRHAHRLIPEMNKDGVGLNQPYQTPDGPMMYPGDPAAPARAIIQCRCTELFKIES